MNSDNFFANITQPHIEQDVNIQNVANGLLVDPQRNLLKLFSKSKTNCCVFIHMKKSFTEELKFPQMYETDTEGKCNIDEKDTERKRHSAFFL